MQAEDKVIEEMLADASQPKQQKEACDTGVASMVKKNVIKTFSDSIILQTVFVSINQILRPSNLSIVHTYTQSGLCHAPVNLCESVNTCEHIIRSFFISSCIHYNILSPDYNFSSH
jgi:hypothetical protein